MSLTRNYDELPLPTGTVPCRHCQQPVTAAEAGDWSATANVLTSASHSSRKGGCLGALIARVDALEARIDASTGKQEPSWRESIEGLGPRELAPVLMDNEADALLSMLEQANNAGIVPGIGLRVEDAQSAGFKIVAERFRDTDPYCRGARTIAVRLRSPNPDDTTSRKERNAT